MSIISTVYVPDGIVMAADSRTTVTMTPSSPGADGVTPPALMFPMSDNTQKVFSLTKVNVGISSCGLPVLDGVTISDFIRSFEINDLRAGEKIDAVASKLASFTQRYGNNVQFHLTGYENDMPYVYVVTNGTSKRVNMNNSEIQYGAAWNGDAAIVNKLLRGEPNANVNFKMLPLGDAIDFAEFMIDTTITYQRFETKPRTCGGPIDILVLTKDTTFWYKHKIFGSRG